MEELVLQERRTLDDVIVSSVETFRNGCNYRLLKEIDGKYYLEYGCHGVYVNLVTGDKRILYLWFKDASGGMKRLSGVVKPETISHLLKMKPCERCGGAKFRVVPE